MWPATEAKDYIINEEDYKKFIVRDKSNLTLTWLGLTRLSLYTPLPPPTTPYRNSTYSRNNDSRGLKFCRRPYQAKLTTIQHNFNPTVFWGGEDKNNRIQTFFWPKNFLTQKFLDTKNFITKNFFWAKNLLTQLFFYPKFFWPKIFFDRKNIFDPTNFFDQNFFWPKKILWPKNFLPKIIFDPNFKKWIVIFHKHFLTKIFELRF